MNKGGDRIGEGNQPCSWRQQFSSPELWRTRQCDDAAQETRWTDQPLLKLSWAQSGDEAQQTGKYLKSKMPENFPET